MLALREIVARRGFVRPYWEAAPREDRRRAPLSRLPEHLRRPRQHRRARAPRRLARARARGARRSASGDASRPGEHDLFYIGGGQDREQALIAPDLAAHGRGAARGGRRRAPRSWPCAAATSCSGASTATATATSCPASASSRSHTVAGERRMIGDVLLECELEPGERRTLAGFENHAGRTYLDEGAEPLGRVVAGFGNDGESGFEGCRVGRVDRHVPARPAAAPQPVARRLAARPGARRTAPGESRRDARRRSSRHAASEARRARPSPRGRARRSAPPVARPHVAASGGLARAQGAQSGAEVDRRVARLPALQEALDRRVQHDLVELVEPNSRWPRTAASCDVTASSERSPRSPAKMMWTTCFAAKLRAGRDRVDDRDRALDRQVVVDPDLLGELAVQRVDEALAGVDAAAGQQPVLAARASRAGRAGSGPRQRRIAETRMRGSVASRARDEPKPRTPRSLAGSSSTSTRLELGDRQDDELGDPHARLDDERLARGRCSAARRGARRGSRSRSGPGEFTTVIPCRAASPERGWTKPA